MAITTSTPFEKIVVYHNVRYPSSIDRLEYITDETTVQRGRINLRNGPPVSGTDGYDDLEILKDIYESDDGFEDSDGSESTIRVSSFTHGTTLNSLTQYGSWNPLQEGSWDDYQTQNEIQSTLGKHGSITTDNDTQRQVIEFQGGIETQAFRPSGDIVIVTLEDWELGYTDSDVFWIHLEIPSTETITENGLDTYTPVRALFAWLESERTTGSSVGTDASNASSSLGSRRYSFRQTNDNTDLVVEYEDVKIETNNDDNVTSYSLAFDRITGADIDTGKLGPVFSEDTEISITNTEQVTESGTIGGYDTEVRTKKLDFDTSSITPSRSGLLISGEDFDGTQYVYVQPVPRMVNYWNLPHRSDLRRILPDIWHFDTIVLPSSSGSDANFQLSNPLEMVGYQGAYRTIAFRNLSSRLFRIYDWDGNLLIVLNRLEYVKYEVSLEGDGNGGRLISVTIPDRYLEYHESAASVRSARHFAYITRWDASTLRYRIVPVFGNYDIVHEDAYSVSTTNPPNRLNGNIFTEGAGDFNMRGIMTVTRRGILEFEWSMLLSLDNDISGQLPNGHGFRLLRIGAYGDGSLGDGGRISVIEDDRHPVFLGDDSQQTLSIKRTITTNPNDRILPVIRYVASSTTIDWEHMHVVDQRINFRLKQNLHITWSG